MLNSHPMHRCTSREQPVYQCVLYCTCRLRVRVPPEAALLFLLRKRELSSGVVALLCLVSCSCTIDVNAHAQNMFSTSNRVSSQFFMAPLFHGRYWLEESYSMCVDITPLTVWGVYVPAVIRKC